MEIERIVKSLFSVDTDAVRVNLEIIKRRILDRALWEYGRNL